MGVKSKSTSTHLTFNILFNLKYNTYLKIVQVPTQQYLHTCIKHTKTNNNDSHW